MLGCFAKLVNGWQPLTILAKWYIHLRCLTGFWICLWYTLIYMLYLLLCNASHSNLKSSTKKQTKNKKRHLIGILMYFLLFSVNSHVKLYPTQTRSYQNKSYFLLKKSYKFKCKKIMYKILQSLSLFVNYY